MMAKVVFMGTPEYGVPVLEALAEHHQVLAVVTQPDCPAGRGRTTLTSPPVKKAARRLGLPIMQPKSLRREPESVQTLAELGADVFVLAAFGQILRQNVLDIPPYGILGVHASLLPRWRGASPITAAILAGDAETGVTLMRTDAGMDTGDIVAARSLRIAAEDTTETLTERLAHLGAELVIDTLPDWLAGKITPVPQDDALATSAPMLDSEDGCIDWSRSAVEIERAVRAYTPWPQAYTGCDERRLKILQAHVVETIVEEKPGTVIQYNKKVAVVTGQGLLVLDRVQMAGKRAMEAQAFVCGQRGFIGSQLAVAR